MRTLLKDQGTDLVSSGFSFPLSVILGDGKKKWNWDKIKKLLLAHLLCPVYF